MKENKVLMVIAGLIAALVIILLFVKSPGQRAAMNKISPNLTGVTTLKVEACQELLQRTARLFSTQQK